MCLIEGVYVLFVTCCAMLYCLGVVDCMSDVCVKSTECALFRNYCGVVCLFDLVLYVCLLKRECVLCLGFTLWCCMVCVLCVFVCAIRLDVFVWYACDSLCDVVWYAVRILLCFCACLFYCVCVLCVIYRAILYGLRVRVCVCLYVCLCAGVM